MPPMPRKSPPGPKKGPNRNLLIAFVAAAVVVAAIVVGALVLGGGDDDGGGSDGPNASAYLDGIAQAGAVLGSADATVTLIQFEDLQCPVCKQYTEEGQPAIVEEYVRPGEVKLRFVGLAFIGPDSEKALLYSLAAGKQGKLWQYTEELYEAQGGENAGWVTDELLEEIATRLELDWDQLQTDADSPEVQKQAGEMAAEGQERKIPGTPWFYVQVGDGEPYEVQPRSFAIEEFRLILDDALQG